MSKTSLLNTVGNLKTGFQHLEEGIYELETENRKMKETIIEMKDQISLLVNENNNYRELIDDLRNRLEQVKAK